MTKPSRGKMNAVVEIFKSLFAILGIGITILFVVDLLTTNTEATSTDRVVQNIPTRTWKIRPFPTPIQVVPTTVVPTISFSRPNVRPRNTIEMPRSSPYPTIDVYAQLMKRRPRIRILTGNSRQFPASLGTEFRGNVWSIRITKAFRGAEANAEIATANMFNLKAPDKSEYVLIHVKITNISTENIARDVAFAPYIGMTGRSNKYFPVADVVLPQSLSGDLFPGGSAEGQLAFLIPSNEKQLMFVINEALPDLPPLFTAYDPWASVAPDTSIALVDTQEGFSRESPADILKPMVVNPIAFGIDEIIRGDAANAMVQQANLYNRLPGQGNEYICIKIHLKYLGTENPDSLYNTFFADTEFRILGHDSVLYETPSVVEPEPRFSDFVSQGVYAGGKITGWIVREIPKNTYRLALQYEPRFDFQTTNPRYIRLPLWEYKR